MTTDKRDIKDVGRVIVLDIVGIQSEHLTSGSAPNIAGLFDEGTTASLRPPFPATTIPVQTTLSTGQSPDAHGDVANGEYDRERDTVALWERDREGRKRLWETASEDAGLTTGALFFQHLMGTTADVAITPSPIEDDDNNILEMNCWTNPDGFYDELQAEYGHFPLHNYWGPAANEQSSEWILTATREAISRYDPDLLWVYIPALDYDPQRHGPDAEETSKAVTVMDGLIGKFLDWLREGDRWSETVVNVVGEYGFHAVDTPVFPNRALREAGLLTVKEDENGGEEIDLADSLAFALVDHQVAHVYTDTPEEAEQALESLPGVETVLREEGKAEYKVGHPNAGECVLIAEPNAWFQYYWWSNDEDAPYYASNMDIHSKPGYDPCALFLGDQGLVSLDPTKISGSHGRVDNNALGFYGLGGPAAPDLNNLIDKDGDTIDARAVAPTIADLLGIIDSLSMSFERSSLLK